MSKAIHTVADLTPDPRNARRHNARNVGMLEQALQEVGAARSIVIDEEGLVLAGNATIEAAAAAGIGNVQVVDADGETLIAVRRSGLTPAQKTKLALYDNRTAELADWDASILQTFSEELDLSGLWNGEELQQLFAPLDGNGSPIEDVEPQIDKADELKKKWGVETGQLWQLGEHRLLCGDATKREDVERVMGGEKAQLCHADPPYGMGKESEGIVNDNLYAAKLDQFQMQWWRACRPSLYNNASAYIWGTAEDLWRLWYVGGLRDSERLTLRNEVVWDKGHGQGMSAEEFRSFPPATERCLFFMLGEQGFNQNADNYWEGWEPIRKYLDDERRALGWTTKQVASWFGFHPRMADHWFSQSQWSFPLREQYERLQAEAHNDGFKRDYDGFKRDYDDLKRDFYATRAYFDNTHDNMTEVWDFPRVTGEERHAHATPKPVKMICRILLSSAEKDVVVFEPFLGSGTTLIAAEQTERVGCFIEINPGYVAVSIQRWVDATHKEPRLL